MEDIKEYLTEENKQLFFEKAKKYLKGKMVRVEELDNELSFSFVGESKFYSLRSFLEKLINDNVKSFVDRMKAKAFILASDSVLKKNTKSIAEEIVSLEVYFLIYESEDFLYCAKMSSIDKMAVEVYKESEIIDALLK